MTERMPSTPTQISESPTSKRLEIYAHLGIGVGLVLQPLGLVIADFLASFLQETIGIRVYSSAFIFYIVLGASTASLVWGSSCLARSKGYYWTWGLLGIASCVGVLFLVVLPNRKGTVIGSTNYRLMVQQHRAVVAITVSTLGALACWPILRFWAAADQTKACVYVVIVALISLLSSLWGSYYLAKRKGYQAAWSVAGLFSFLGCLFLFLLPDRHRQDCPELNRSLKDFQLGVCLVVILGAVLTAIDIPMGVSHMRASRDKVAFQTVANLGKALAKFADERARSNCNTANIPEDIIQYMVGPYYGWSGTSAQPEVLVRIEDEAACACAPGGSQPSGATRRYIYRVKLSDGSQLPALQGPCFGNNYGVHGSKCYTESVLNQDCTLRIPRGIQCK
jgi:hypothetical protein